MNDIYSYSVLSVKNSGNTIQVKGKLYISPEDESISAGVSTVNGGRIYLNDEIFINGTLQYEAESQCLFGIAYIPVENGIYQSSESIGGGNIKFYFPDYTPEYAKGFFTPDFERLSQQEQCNLIFEYISTPPSSEQDISQYSQHLGEMDLGSNHLNNENSLSGYTSGLIFANNKTLEPLSMPEPEVFFENILKEMKFQTGWDYNSQINCNISVPLVNTVLEGNILSVIDPEQAIVCIVPENKDLSIPSGEYRGIIMTNGSIHIPSDSNVVFNGLLIAGENLMVEGKLTQSKDKDIILNLLDTQDGTLSKFFRIEQEKPLFEIISCSESLYSEQW